MKHRLATIASLLICMLFLPLEGSYNHSHNEVIEDDALFIKSVEKLQGDFLIFRESLRRTIYDNVGQSPYGRSLSASCMANVTEWYASYLYQHLVENAHFGNAKAPGVERSKTTQYSEYGVVFDRSTPGLWRSQNGHFQLDAGIQEMLLTKEGL